MILWTSRVRLGVNGIDNFKPGVPYVLCVNHQSHMDIPIILAALPIQFRFAAKKQLFRYPFLGWHLRRSGHVPIDRENPHAAVKSLREAAEKMRQGTPVVIFPEGGRGLPDGEMLRFKGGAVRLALEADVPILPVTIRGAHRVWPAGRTIPRPAKVEITYHPLFTVKQGPGEETRVCARRESDRLASIIKSAL